jgi:hypothetical protein
MQVQVQVQVLEPRVQVQVQVMVVLLPPGPLQPLPPQLWPLYCQALRALSTVLCWRAWGVSYRSPFSSACWAPATVRG